MAVRAAFSEVRFRLDDESVAPNNQNVVMCPSTVIAPSDVIFFFPRVNIFSGQRCAVQHMIIQLKKNIHMYTLTVKYNKTLK